MPDVNGMVMAVLAALLGALAISLPLTWMMVRAGHRLGALDSAGSRGHAKELRRVPNIGGVGIFHAVVLPMLAGLIGVWVIDGETWSRWLPALEPHLPRIRETTPTALAMVSCMTVLHVIGLVDDRRGLSPWIKLAVQFAAAAVMTLFFEVRLLTVLDGYVPGASIAVTLLWIVAMTNALNFLDNMDGLAGGVAAIASFMFMLATILNEQWFIAGTLALMVGGLCGFLVFNFPPARIFMGDGGSLVIGFLLSILTARTTFYDPAQADFALGTAWYGVFMPVVVQAIPLYDFCTVTIIRLRQGRSPFVGDQQHFSHRLVQRGLSKRGAVIIIWGFTAITGAGGIALGSLAPWQAVLVGAQTILILIVLAMLEHASRRVPGRIAESDGDQAGRFTTETQSAQRRSKGEQGS